MNTKKHLTNSGFSIIEVMLAVSLFVIFVSGMATVALRGMDNNRTAINLRLRVWRQSDRSETRIIHTLSIRQGPEWCAAEAACGLFREQTTYLRNILGC